MKPFTFNYLHRLILFGVLLSTVPVMVIGTYAYYKASSDAQKKMEVSNSQIVQQTRMRVEQTLQITDRSLTQFIIDPLVYKLLDSALHPEEFQTYSALQLELSKLMTFELGVTEIHFVNFANGWEMSSLGKRDLSQVDEYDQYLFFKNYPKTSFWASPHDTVDAISPSTCKVRMVKKLPIGNPNPKGLIIVDIPCDYLSSQLAEAEVAGSLYMFDEQNRILAAGHNRISADSSYEPLFAQLQTADFRSNMTVSMDGEQFLASFQKSAYTHWSFVLLLPFESVTSESRSIGWVMLYIVLGILLLCFALATIGSRRLYHPIRHLYNTLRTSNLHHVGRGSNELHFIQQSVTDLLHDRTKLSAETKKQLRTLNDFFVLKLIQGGTREHEIREQLEQYGYPSDWKQLIVLAADIDTLEGTEYTPKDWDLLMFAINNITSELVPSFFRLNPVLAGQAQIIIMLDDGEDADKCKSMADFYARSIQKNVLKYLKLKISFGISPIYSHFEDIPKAYNEALEALKYRIRFGNGVLLYMEELEPKERSRLRYSEKVKNDLTDKIKYGGEDEVRKALDQFIGELFSEDRLQREYQILLAQLVFHLIAEVSEMENLHEDSKLMFEQLLELNSKQEIELWLKNIVVTPIVQQIRQRENSQAAKLSQEIKHLIHEHYKTDLSLDYCADQLGYHPNYIKRVFRQYTGMNFSDYLMEYRIAKVKHWLVETDMKIAEIAEKIRYNNPQNLIRSFRKIVGMTPGEYREKMKRE